MPVPCVPVESAPAIAWVSISPWLASDSPICFQRAADVADPRAGAHGDALAIEVGADKPLHVLQAQQQAAGGDDRREGMAGAGDADAEIAPGGLAHHRGQHRLAVGLGLIAGDEGLVADPIAPESAFSNCIIPLPEPRRRHSWRSIAFSPISQKSHSAPPARQSPLAPQRARAMRRFA